MLVENFRVDSPAVQYSDEFITSNYQYSTTDVSRDESGGFVCKPLIHEVQFRVERKVPKLG